MNKRRVKVYQLDDNGQWRDEGTGYVESRFVDGNLVLTVTSEENESVTLLNSTVSIDEPFQKQQETLIVWNEQSEDNENGVDLALSFQEAAGCQEIWTQITEFQKSGKAGYRMAEEIDESVDEYLDDSSYFQDLPPPNLKNLDEIIARLHSLAGPDQKERFAAAVLRDNYLKKLIDLFNVIEDVDDRPSLYKMYEIWKSLVMLNVSTLLERIFQPDLILDVFGALEYDPDLGRKLNHREFLKSHVVFKEVVPLKPPIIDLIHMTFRLQYMKDVALPRVLDEATFAMLNSLIYFNNVRIVTELKKDEDFLRKLFGKLKQPTTGVEDTKDLVRFVNELCELGKNMEPKIKLSLYTTLDRHGLFEAIERALSLPGADDKLRMHCVEVLVHTVENDPSLLRRAIVKQKLKRYQFMNQLIKLFHSNCDSGIKNLLMDVFRLLLESEITDSHPEKYEFLNLFYSDFIKALMEPIFQELPNGIHSESESLMKGNLLELLTFFVQQHGYRIRYWLLDNGAVVKVLRLLKCQDKHLVLAALRFFKAFVGVNDKFFIKHIVKENLFKPIVELFLENQSRYNMINSAILDLFNFIKLEGSKTLTHYFVENFYSQVQHITYTDVFHLMKMKAKDEEEFGPAGRVTPNKITRLEDDKFTREVEEDSYFDADDDFDPPVPLSGLVSYPDTDEAPLPPQKTIEPPSKPTGASADSTQSKVFDYFAGLPSSSDDPPSSSAKVTTTATGTKLVFEIEEDIPVNRRKRKSSEIEPDSSPTTGIRFNLGGSPGKTHHHNLFKDSVEAPPAKRLKEDDPPPSFPSTSPPENHQDSVHNQSSTNNTDTDTSAIVQK